MNPITNPDEPLFANLDDNDPALAAALAAAVREAEQSLPSFKAAFLERRLWPAAYAVKLPFIDRSQTGEKALVRTPDVVIENPAGPIARLWLSVTSILEDLLFCSIEEAPRELRLNRHDSFVVDTDIVEDWMINQDGVVYGGFSLRLIRNQLSAEGQRQFDDHTGIREFKLELP